MTDPFGHGRGLTPDLTQQDASKWKALALQASAT